MCDLNEKEKIEETIEDVAELRERALGVKLKAAEGSGEEWEIIEDLSDQMSRLCDSYIDTLIILESKVADKDE